MLTILLEKLMSEDFKDQFKSITREEWEKRLGKPIEELEEMVVRLLIISWQQFAPDMFDSMNSGMAADEQTTELSGDEVAEIIGDLFGTPVKSRSDQVAVDFWNGITNDEQNELLKKAFPPENIYT